MAKKAKRVVCVAAAVLGGKLRCLKYARRARGPGRDQLLRAGRELLRLRRQSGYYSIGED